MPWIKSKSKIIFILGFVLGIVIAINFELYKIKLGWVGSDAQTKGILRDSALASWVQAVGSLVAIAVAIAIPYYLDRKRGEEEFENKKIAYRLAITVLRLRLNPLHAALEYLRYLSEEGRDQTQKANPRWRFAVVEMMERILLLSPSQIDAIAAFDSELANDWYIVVGNFEQILHGLKLKPGPVDEKDAETIKFQTKGCIQILEKIRSKSET